MCIRGLLPTVIALLTLAAIPARGQGFACYREGVEAMKTERFEAAAEAFARMQRVPACAETIDGLMYNEAVALHRLAEAAREAAGDLPSCRALYAYRRALPVARDATRPAIEEAIAELTPKCPPAGELSVVCDPPGATVRIRALGADRGCPARYSDVRPGVYAGEAISGREVVRFEVEVKSGQMHEQLVRFKRLLPPDRPPPAQASRADPPVEAAANLAPFGWVSLGLAAAAAGVGTWAYLEGQVVAEKGQAVADLGQNRSTADTDRFATLTDEHDTLRTVHLVSVLTAAILGAAGATLLVLDDDGRPREGAARALPASALLRF